MLRIVIFTMLGLFLFDAPTWNCTVILKYLSLRWMTKKSRLWPVAPSVILLEGGSIRNRREPVASASIALEVCEIRLLPATFLKVLA